VISLTYIKIINKFLAFLSLGFLLFCSSLYAAAPAKIFHQWRTIQTRHFAINYYEGEEEVARKLVSISEEVYENLSKKFDVYPRQKTEVMVLNHHDIARELSTVIPYNIMLIKTSAPWSSSIWSHYDDWLRELFIHEYIHILHRSDTHYPAKLLKPIFGTLDTPNGLVPAWMSEGFADYFESAETGSGRGHSSFTDMILRTDILKDQFLYLDQMSGTQIDWPGPITPNIYGVGFLSYLAKTYGEEKLIALSHKIGGSLWFYSFNNKAKKVFKDEQGNSKSFYLLWRDWKKELQQKYEKVKEEVVKKGLQEGDLLVAPKKGETFSLPVLSADGQRLAYIANSTHHSSELRLRNLKTGKEKVLAHNDDVQQIEFSPDGEKLLFSYVGPYKGFYRYSDLHEIDLKTGDVTDITKGDRAREGDYSKDGKKIVAVIQKTGESSLGVYDLETKTWKVFFTAEQLNHPRWLPDNHSIVFLAHQRGQENVWVIDTNTSKSRPLIFGADFKDYPVVDASRQFLYFTSDRTGISNIYRYDLKTHKTYQVTQVLTGAFTPSVTLKGFLVFQYYTGKGFEIRRMFPSKFLKEVFVPSDSYQSSKVSETQKEKDPLEKSKVYDPFRKLLAPHFLVPKVALLDGTVSASLSTQNFDPLRRHLWNAGLFYRNDKRYLGVDAGYTYARLLLPLSLNYNRYLINYGDAFGLGDNYFEERNRISTGFSIPLSPHSFIFNYFFEKQSEKSGLPAGAILVTLGHHAGLSMQYGFHKTEGTVAGISPEKGMSFVINYEISNSFFGSSENLKQQLVWGDVRAYLPIPIAPHHILALRAAGGDSFGDVFIQGNYSLGGSAGESPFRSVTSRLFTLRGLPLVSFSRDRAWVASAEYRIPLFRSQRGMGTMPLSSNSTHLGFFMDVGDAFDRGESIFRPMLGVGSELRSDLMIGYNIPLTTRLGYGIILTHRDRLAGFKDNLTSADVKNGIIILDIGTTF